MTGRPVGDLTKLRKTFASKCGVRCGLSLNSLVSGMLAPSGIARILLYVVLLVPLE